MNPNLNQHRTPLNPYHAPNAPITHDVYDEYDTSPFYKASGRIGRIRYLAYNMIYGLCYIPVMIVAILVLLLLQQFSENVASVVGVVMYVLGIITNLYMYFALAKRRLNDMNKTGWLALLLLVPIINIIFWLYLVFGRGDDYVNDYGAPAEPPSSIMKILAMGIPVVFILGILAAIALPAYQNYIQRSQQSQLHLEQQYAIHD